MGERGASSRWRPRGGRATPTIDDDPIVVDLTDDATFGGPIVDLTDRGAAQRYSDWAERLRAKRVRDQAHILGADPAGAGGGPSHWSADSLLGDDTSSTTGPAPLVADAADALRCLGVLGLAPGATSDEEAAAYRRLAKLHHPDRWAEAAPEVRQLHSEEMLRVNAAYQALRSELRAR